VRGLFFLAVAGDLPAPFVQAIMAIGYRPIPLQGDGKVVDIAIQRTLDAIRDRDADVVLGSHDGDFLPQLEACSAGGSWPSWRSRVPQQRLPATGRPRPGL
jgi:uncharacterized protein